MKWSDMMPKQQQTLIDAEKNATNGPLPMSPDEALLASESQDRINELFHKQAIQQSIFSWRRRVESAQRSRQTRVSVTLYSKRDNVEAEIKGLETVRHDLTNSGWHTFSRVKHTVLGPVLILCWSTAPFTWWDKLWIR